MTVWCAGLDESYPNLHTCSHVPIIRRINCIDTTSGIYVTVYR